MHVKINYFGMIGRIVALLFIALFAIAGTSAQTAQTANPVLASLEGTFLRPGFITSAGQTSDAAIVKVLANTRLKLGFDYDIMAKPEAVAGAKTLVIVLGASNKGLGSAGLSFEQEMERVKKVIATAQKAGAKILSMHTGGSSRRGELSNAVIELCIPVSSAVIVVEEGNKDGFFTELCAKHSIPLQVVPSIAEAGNVLKALIAP